MNIPQISSPLPLAGEGLGERVSAFWNWKWNMVLTAIFLVLSAPLAVWAADEAASLLRTVSLPADVVAAWQSEARFSGQNQSAATYHNGYLYGFAFSRLPHDADDSVQSRLRQAQVKWAEARSTNVLGLFAFNAFECAALQQYESIQPDAESCKKIPLTNVWAGERGGQVYGVAKAPASAICACRKFLDKPGSGDNTSIYYAAIAAEELVRLSEAGEHQAVADFFLKNYKRRIFAKEKLILAAASFAKLKRNEEAGSILDAVVAKFADALTSAECEAIGDSFYAIGEEDKAEKMYERAAEKLHFR